MNRQTILKRTAYTFGCFALSFLVVGSLFLSSLPSDITIFTNETKILNLPLKSVTISVMPEQMLVVGGHSVGVKMDVKGVLVVGLEEIPTEAGEMINPGLEAGLQIGDSVLTINGQAVENAAEVQALINEVQDEVKIKIKRKGKTMTIKVMPVLSSDEDQYRLGLWVRDKTAGLGTLTYYNPSDGTFGALGHAITDPETGDVLTVADGELLNSKVESVKVGKAGTPGEIRGIFYEADSPLGELTLNSEYGIFGTMYGDVKNPVYPQLMEVGYQNEVEKGPAYILSTLDGNTVERYEIEVEKVTAQSRPDTKSMVIRVTDERLLAASGGIVQGMSGSPIVQNGKIIGAVTHVFVNDPQRGYGIYIEWMLKQAEEGN